MQNDRRQQQFDSQRQPDRNANGQRDGYPSGEPIYQSNQSPGYSPYQSNQQNPSSGFNPYPPAPPPNNSQNPEKTPAAPVQKPEQKKGFLEKAKEKVKKYTDKF